MRYRLRYRAPFLHAPFFFLHTHPHARAEGYPKNLPKAVRQSCLKGTQTFNYKYQKTFLSPKFSNGWFAGFLWFARPLTRCFCIPRSRGLVSYLNDDTGTSASDSFGTDSETMAVSDLVAINLSPPRFYIRTDDPTTSSVVSSFPENHPAKEIHPPGTVGADSDEVGPGCSVTTFSPRSPPLTISTFGR